MAQCEMMQSNICPNPNAEGESFDVLARESVITSFKHSRVQYHLNIGDTIDGLITDIREGGGLKLNLGIFGSIGYIHNSNCMKNIKNYESNTYIKSKIMDITYGESGTLFELSIKHLYENENNKNDELKENLNIQNTQQQQPQITKNANPYASINDEDEKENNKSHHDQKEKKKENKNPTIHTHNIKHIAKHLSESSFIDPKISVFDEQFVLNIAKQAIKKGTLKKVTKAITEIRHNPYKMIINQTLTTPLDIVYDNNDEDELTIVPHSYSGKKIGLDYHQAKTMAKAAKSNAKSNAKCPDLKKNSKCTYTFDGYAFSFAGNQTTILNIKRINNEETV